MTDFRILINGELTEASDSRNEYSIDPGNGQPVSSFAFGGVNEANEAVLAARNAFDQGPWPHLSAADRAGFLVKFADLMQANIGRLSMLESRDSGGLVDRTAFDVMQGVRFIRRMARYTMTGFPWREELPKGSQLNPSYNYVLREPIGVCVAIIPWNFPLLMAVWKITMALLTGNTLVLKPAPDTPLSALMLGELLIKSHIPAGVVNIVTGPGQEIGETLVRHPYADRIAFTGSTTVGRRIMEMAAGTTKRVTLELGGKSANIILDDADLDMAIDGALFAGFLHSGQVCESGTRLLVPASIGQAIISELVARAKLIRVGYQLDTVTNMGPVINEKHCKSVEHFIEKGQKEGAVLLTGGGRSVIPGYEGGYYLEPTIFSHVNPGMTLAQEEIFGPVISVLTYQSEEEALTIANSSKYGLAAGIWSRNIARAESLAARLHAGTVWINDWHIFHDFGPFGGYKQSGIGRELGRYGLETYTEVKHVHVGTEGEAAAKPGHRTLHKRNPPLGYEYAVPTRIISGPGSITRLASETASLVPCRFLLITDPGVIAAGIIDRVIGVVGSLVVSVFDAVPQDSGLSVVDSAVAEGRRAGASAILSVGGGSVIDTGKAVAAAIGIGARAIDLVGINHLEGKRLPHIVIPTTAGTGSEVTNMIVLRNESLNLKSYVVDKLVFPDLAILDAQLTIRLPPLLTASTAMDALTHAIEAFTSRRANPVSDAYALHAISLISSNLVRVVDNGNDLPARSAMLSAANLAGYAIASAQVGLVHGMSHALGARHGVPHGSGNGILLPHVMRWNAKIPAAAERYTQVAKALGADVTGTSNEEAAAMAADRVASLLFASKHPSKLGEVGIRAEDLPSCAAQVLSDVAILTNARPVVSVQEIENIYLNALI